MTAICAASCAVSAANAALGALRSACSASCASSTAGRCRVTHGEPLFVTATPRTSSIRAKWSTTTTHSRAGTEGEIRELHNILLRHRVAYESLPAGQRHQGVRPLKRESELALWIMLSTLCRAGETLKAAWKDVDLDKGEWFLPAANTKTNVAMTVSRHVRRGEFERAPLRPRCTLTRRA